MTRASQEERDRRLDGEPSQRAGPDGPRHRGVWTFTMGRLIVLYLAATLFGANVALAVVGGAGVSPVGAALGAVAMSLLSVIVLTVSYRPASDAGRRSEPPDRG